MIAGKMRETGGEPKSMENGQRPPREERPVKVFVGGQELHAAIPESPPTFNFAVALCVVSAGGGVLGTGGVQHRDK